MDRRVSPVIAPVGARHLPGFPVPLTASTAPSREHAAAGFLASRRPPARAGADRTRVVAAAA